jgi:hypothetical protein
MREDCSCLLSIASLYLQTMSKGFQPATVPSVLQTMIFVVERSLEASYTNCGAYGELSFLSTITLRNLWFISPVETERLLDLCAQCEAKGLLTQDAKTQLAQAEGLVADFRAYSAESWNDCREQLSVAYDPTSYLNLSSATLPNYPA